ncbi:MAG: adenosylcobalamin-dependent ribonucleoside-diphosphate reductase [Gammaproteobacteria bacterium]|nr:adenosylcobalamin-dependent ribonucleoside-diphosphate reductase [Gammaproteobacteria bacterium]
MTEPTIDTPIARLIWRTKYRHAGEEDVTDTWQRVAAAIAAAEPRDRAAWRQRFVDLLRGFRFLPGGRILAGAGTGNRVTLFNCFVMGTIEDSMEGIFQGLKEGALTMQQGGGVGYDFSTLRPAGTVAHATGTVSSGPVAFMNIWDAMCATVLSTGARRGAMMATLRCDHPDIEAFVHAKAGGDALTRFNLSVLVSDAFMAAVEADRPWALRFPGPGGEIHREVPARALWDDIMRATYDAAEPGVLFLDTINRENNLGYCEDISATNPCGEIPLPPYGACNLGALNLARFVTAPFSGDARLDLDALAAAVPTAVRFLDNVIEVSRFPLPRQQEQAQRTRRIGLGITGLADALIMVGLPYDSDAGRALAAAVMTCLRDAAYRASVDLAAERGPCPAFEREAYLAAPFVTRLPADVRDGIARHGIRNSHLVTIAPTGTISLLADNVSGGIEPVYSFEGRRRVLQADGSHGVYDVTDRAFALWRAAGSPALGNDVLVRADQLPPRAHIAMQAAVQPFVDNAVSKTVNIAPDHPFADFKELYRHAYRQGLKGCTTYRPNAITGAVLEHAGNEEEPACLEGSHCCTIEREAD